MVKPQEWYREGEKLTSLSKYLAQNGGGSELSEIYCVVGKLLLTSMRARAK